MLPGGETHPLARAPEEPDDGRRMEDHQFSDNALQSFRINAADLEVSC